MGLCGSKQPGTTPAAAPSPLDEKLAATLKKRLKVDEKERASWTKIVLNFKKINAHFLKIKAVFDKHDQDKSNSIELEELHGVLKDLGATGDYNHAEVEEIFKAADRSRTNSLNRKEFLVCMAICYLLNTIPAKKDDATHLDLQEVFGMVIDAFLAFDEDASGYIDKDEVMSMFSKSDKKKMIKSNTKKAKMVKNTASTSVIGEQKWKQMDWDADGNITFKEFLFAFSTWTGMDDDEDHTQ